MESRITVADVVAQACAAHGVKRAFGVPGGGSSLDLIEAFARCGIEFQLCRTETGATLMAAADGELRNSFGVSVATQGPGAASAMNGLAHASLDRAPVLFISDGWTRKQLMFDTHQVFDQRAMSAPVVRASSRLESEDPAGELDALIAGMLTAPWGPAHIELTGETARRPATGRSSSRPRARPSQAAVRHGDMTALLAASRKPVLIVGLEARDDGAAAEIARLAKNLRCPVLTTYKAKGIVSDESGWLVGHFTGGAAEGDCISRSDLIVLCGLDPVELIGKPWLYTQPVIDIALVKHPVHYLNPQAASYGGLAESLAALGTTARASDWASNEIAQLHSDMRARLAYCGEGAGLTPQQVVETAMQMASPRRPAIAVDAGAHMFSAMAFWRSIAAGDALISNGLATMAYALPAGIARALAAPEDPTLVFTGDGGLLMCAGELATAAQSGANVCVVVFNDGALSLIALKQQNRGMAEAGVSWKRVDFAGMARAFGMRAFAASTVAEYESALRSAFSISGPCLIDVHVDAGGYRSQAKSLRG